MAKTKSGGKTKQQPARPGKRLGVKIFGGQKAKLGSIIVRQRGTKFSAGEGVGMGKDHTLFALQEGVVAFKEHWGKKIVAVLPAQKGK